MSELTAEVTTVFLSGCRPTPCAYRAIGGPLHVPSADRKRLLRSPITARLQQLQQVVPPHKGVGVPGRWADSVARPAGAVGRFQEAENDGGQPPGFFRFLKSPYGT